MATGIKDKVAILGMGCSRFGERWDCGTEALLNEAFQEALADAGIERRQIGAAWYGSGIDRVNVGNSAIPMSTAKQVLADIVRDGKVTRGWIGVEPNDLSPELAETFGVKANSGVIITGVLQNGPAARAGIRPGDVVTGVGEQRIDNVQQLLTAVAGLKPGVTARFALQRGTDQMALDVTSGQRPKLPVRRNPESEQPR